MERGKSARTDARAIRRAQRGVDELDFLHLTETGDSFGVLRMQAKSKTQPYGATRPKFVRRKIGQPQERSQGEKRPESEAPGPSEF